MKKISFLLISLLVLTSCKTVPKLQKVLACNKMKKLNNLGAVNDINNNFSLSIPTNWNTNFYYNNIQSEIYTADTTKPLSKATIIETTLYVGSITFNTSFLNEINHKISKTEGLKISYKRKELIHNFSTYWLLAAGNKKVNKTEYPYHLFLIYLKITPQSYITYTAKVYGKDAIKDRFCTSYQIFNSLKLLKQ